MTQLADRQQQSGAQTEEHEGPRAAFSRQRGRPRKQSVTIETAGTLVEIPTITYTTRAYSVEFLLAMVDQGRIAYPEFQRAYVYRPEEERFLWQTALLHFPMTAPWAYYDEEDDTFYILDGQQRIRGLCAFPRSKRTLFTKQGRQAHMPNSQLPLIEPGKTFRGMSKEWQKRYLSYEVPIMVITGLPEIYMPDAYYIINIHRRLSPGEELWSRNSATIQATRQLASHPFWEQVYNGKNERMERTTETLTAIAFELCSPIAQVRMAELLNLASGTQDHLVTPDLVARIDTRLSHLGRLFQGVGAVARTDIIPIYQAGLYLEQAGFDLAASEAGCLVPWWQRGKKGSWTGTQIVDRIERASQFNTYAHLPHRKGQVDFWREQEAVLYAQKGLVKKEERQASTALEKPWFDGRHWTTV